MEKQKHWQYLDLEFDEPSNKDQPRNPKDSFPFELCPQDGQDPWTNPPSQALNLEPQASTADRKPGKGGPSNSDRFFQPSLGKYARPHPFCATQALAWGAAGRLSGRKGKCGCATGAAVRCG